MGKPAEPFALDAATRHLCIDMQRLFAVDTPWQVPWLPKVLPAVEEIAGRHASQTIFTRFIPALSPDEAEGAWRDYYAAWPDLTRRKLDPELLDLVPALARLVPPGRLVDKTVNSAFGRTGFAQALKRAGVTTLVVTGGETDVCVLATVMAAIDHGFGSCCRQMRFAAPRTARTMPCCSSTGSASRIRWKRPRPPMCWTAGTSAGSGTDTRNRAGPRPLCR